MRAGNVAKIAAVNGTDRFFFRASTT